MINAKCRTVERVSVAKNLTKDYSKIDAYCITNLIVMFIIKMPDYEPIDVDVEAVEIVADSSVVAAVEEGDQFTTVRVFPALVIFATLLNCKQYTTISSSFLLVNQC